MVGLIQLKSSDVAEVRDAILEEQNGLCAICGEPIEDDDIAHLDHQHRLKSSEIGLDGGGLVRGVLHMNCNVFEGKIWNNSKRFGLHDDLSGWLRNLADYLDRDNYPIIHHTEKPKEKKLKKSSYNKLKKTHIENNTKGKFPEYPKSKKVSKKLKELFEHHDITPEYYGGSNG